MTRRGNRRMPGLIRAAALSCLLGRGALAAGLMADHKHVPAAVDAKAPEIVTVKKAGEWEKGGITVMTEAVAVKETGPKETVARFGEVYAFSPSFIGARRERPLLIRFWNLQPDDEHDFTLFDAKGRVLASIDLPPLAEVSYSFTFHKEGLYDYRCTIHQPGMSGQLLVLPKNSGD